MTRTHQFSFSKRERQIVVEALIRMQHSARGKRARSVRSKEIDALVRKFLDDAHPDITVGVHGG